jgi:monoamine oxidase
VNNEFNKIIAKDSTLNTPLVKSIYNAMLYEERYDNGCLDLNELNVDGYNEYVVFKGDTNTNLKYGYKKLIDYFVSRLPSKSLKANEVVSNINWPKTSSLVTITTSKGTYQAKQILVTASLGYLKSNYNTLFSPALPANKINSINKIGFGIVDKIFLIYDKPVFANFNQVQGLQILWRDDLKFSLDNTKAKCSLIVT